MSGENTGPDIAGLMRDGRRGRVWSSKPGLALAKSSVNVVTGAINVRSFTASMLARGGSAGGN